MTDDLTTDNGRLERSTERIRAWRESGDYSRFRVGLRVAREDRYYGAGVVDSIASDTGFPKSSLYEYAQVSKFLVAWLGFSAARIFDDYPLSYSHVRRAVRLEYEEAIEALLHAANEAMTVDEFGVYCAKIEGKPVPQKPIFDKSGPGWQVGFMLRQFLGEIGNKRVRVTVREMREQNGKEKDRLSGT